MQDSPPTPPDPAVRFRLRTLLMVTTAIAVLAAAAGPYYRSVDADGRRNLLIFWSLIVAFTGVSFWLRLRESLWRDPNRQVRFVVYAAAGSRLRSRPTLTILGITFLALWLVLYSWVIVEDSAQGAWHFFVGPWYQGFIIGSTTAGLIFGLVRRPMYLCEEGVPLAKGQTAPWRYIRRAERLPGRPGVVKLRRFDGDIFLDVPPAVRDEVEAFLREKTTFAKVDRGGATR